MSDEFHNEKVILKSEFYDCLDFKGNDALRVVIVFVNIEKEGEHFRLQQRI